MDLLPRIALGCANFAPLQFFGTGLKGSAVQQSGPRKADLVALAILSWSSLYGQNKARRAECFLSDPKASTPEADASLTDHCKHKFELFLLALLNLERILFQPHLPGLSQHPVTLGA